MATVDSRDRHRKQEMKISDQIISCSIPPPPLRQQYPAMDAGQTAASADDSDERDDLSQYGATIGDEVALDTETHTGLKLLQPAKRGRGMDLTRRESYLHLESDKEEEDE